MLVGIVAIVVVVVNVGIGVVICAALVVLGGDVRIIFGDALVDAF